MFIVSNWRLIKFFLQTIKELLSKYFQRERERKAFYQRRKKFVKVLFLFLIALRKALPSLFFSLLTNFSSYLFIMIKAQVCVHSLWFFILLISFDCLPSSLQYKSKNYFCVKDFVCVCGARMCVVREMSKRKKCVYTK